MPEAIEGDTRELRNWLNGFDNDFTSSSMYNNS